jgi:hypothetical protein
LEWRKRETKWFLTVFLKRRKRNDKF